MLLFGGVLIVQSKAYVFDQYHRLNSRSIPPYLSYWFINVAVLTIGCRRFDHRLSPFWPKIFSVLTNDCRRFDQWLSPFWLIVVAVLTYALSPFWPQLSPFLLSPFWRVAVFVVAVPTCRRYDLYPGLTTDRHRWNVLMSGSGALLDWRNGEQDSLERTEMIMLRWMMGMKSIEKINMGGEIRVRAGVANISDVVSCARLTTTPCHL